MRFRVTRNTPGKSRKEVVIGGGGRKEVDRPWRQAGSTCRYEVKVGGRTLYSTREVEAGRKEVEGEKERNLKKE